MSADLMTSIMFDEIQIGQTAELQRTLTRDDIALFGRISGDLNAIPIDQACALRSGAKGVVGHSLWATGLISNLITQVLPGPGALYQGQDSQFHRQVHLGDTLTARIKVRDKSGENIVRFECMVSNQHGETVMTGVAEVKTPAERIQIKRPDRPNISSQHHDSFGALFEAAESLEPTPTAVVHPCDPISLQGAMDAAAEHLIRPILVGPERKIRAIADAEGIPLAGVEIVNVEHSHAAAERSVRLVREGAADILMKGSLHTDEVLAAVVHKTHGMRTERRISHVFVMDVPTYPKLLLISDAAVNIAPDLEVKRDICQNAIDLAQTLEVESPKVAILSAVETIRPKIQSTLDAAALCKMADRGQITGARLDGPLAMDNAINLEAARIKKIHSDVAGVADILITPDLESGNILAKQLIFLANAEAAGVVLGAKAPIALTSRADSVCARKASAAIAVLHADAIRRGIREVAG